MQLSLSAEHELHSREDVDDTDWVDVTLSGPISLAVSHEDNRGEDEKKKGIKHLGHNAIKDS